ncbi:putative arabinogalactan endo-beta-1,4-galactanase A [Cytospora mali]|uniref:Arabinogalactan endo-beta-1,4-galactanase n=1 Tax=Cytospora mali TaxID=578113 RepID=A0A194VE73_CYTMA|nr:putative arabinogalactan endo-beta-1,4-galactanase A [Valsa mali var. pyri (nom. inval.)]
MKPLAACFTTLTTLAAVAAGHPKPPSQTFFYKGHDLSSLGTMETSDNIYIDTSRGNATRPADDILADGGMNGVRLRLWVDPEGGTNGLDYTLALAKRFQARGHRLYLDFHFADSWADPSKQPTPASWPHPDQGLEALASTLRAYVRDTLVSFSRAGVAFDIVSLGNEIRHGMLWPLGYVDVDTQPHAALVRNFSNLATLYSAARAGLDDAFDVHDHASHAGGGSGVFSKPPLAMIHIDDGWNLTLQRAWFGALEASGVARPAWDVFGFSFYPFYGTPATFASLRASLGALAGEYGKPVHVVETDYPAVCDGEYDPVPESSEPEIAYSVGGQVEWVREVVRVVREVPGGLGRGVWYWEPAWLNNTSLGSDCNDAILFEADYSNWPETIGYSRPSVNIFLDD